MTKTSTATAKRGRIPNKPLPGKLAAPNLPRRTMTRLPEVNLRPTAANQAAIIVADRVVAELALTGAGLTRRTLPSLLSEASARAVAELDGKRMDRRASVVAKSMAAHVLRYHQPIDLVPVRLEWLTAAVRDVGDGGALISRRRITWCDRSGLTAGLMIDRLHHTHLPGMLLDPWMSRKVADDTRAGRAIAGEAFLGVRVLSHRAPLASLHVTAPGEQHLLGQCGFCSGRVI